MAAISRGRSPTQEPVGCFLQLGEGEAKPTLRTPGQTPWASIAVLLGAKFHNCNVSKQQG